MQNLYRNSLVFVLLIAIMFPINMAFISYKIQLKLVKHQVKRELIANLDKEDLVNLQFDLAGESFKQLKWKDGHEFEYQGLMFDIVQADTLGTSVHYLCFPDKQETALNHLFKEHLQDNYAKNKGLKHRASQMLSLLMSLDMPIEEVWAFGEASDSAIRFADYTAFFYNSFLDIPSPPPKFSQA